MSTIKQFEDLLAWQRSRELVREIYKSLQNCRDMGFRDQIQRAAVSVMSNIAEGFESGTRQEFLNYLYIAKGSAGEVRAQVYAAHDIGYLNIETFKYLKGLAEECSKLISSFIFKLKSGGQPGIQYKQEKSKAQREREEFDDYLRKYIEEKKTNPDAKFDEGRFKK